jgi:hypothetical protein
MEGENKVTLEVTPFVALTVLTLASLFESKLSIDDKLRIAIQDYRDEAVRSMSMDDIDDAFLEKEIYEMLTNAKKNPKK